MLYIEQQPILETPLAKTILEYLQGNVLNPGSQSNWNLIAPEGQKLPVFLGGQLGLVAAITDWMFLDGRNPMSQGNFGTLSKDAFPYPYFDSAAFLAAALNHDEATLDALVDVDWSVPWEHAPWAWLAAHAHDIDWKQILDAILALPNQTRAVTAVPQKGNPFGLYTFEWIGNIPGTGVSWTNVPFTLFSIPSFSEALHWVPWESVDWSNVTPSTAGVLAALGLNATPTTSFPTQQQGANGYTWSSAPVAPNGQPSTSGSVILAPIVSVTQNPTTKLPIYVPKGTGCPAGQVKTKSGACVPASEPKNSSASSGDGGGMSTGAILGWVVVAGVAVAIFVATVMQKPAPAAEHRRAA